MAFQSTINTLLNLGVIGDIVLDEPHRIEMLTLDSGGGTMGYGFTKSQTTGIGTVGGTIAAATPFAGIACLPKQLPAFGSAAVTPLAPGLTLQPNSQVAMLTFGSLIVNIGNAYNVGDQVVMTTATGVLGSIAYGGTPAGGTIAIPNCIVRGYPGQAAAMAANASGGLAIIRLSTVY